MTQEELQQAHEQELAALIEKLTSGRGSSQDSDWALVRALVHKAVHLAAERKAGEFCALAMLLAEQLQHAHSLMHPSTSTSGGGPKVPHDSYMH